MAVIEEGSVSDEEFDLLDAAETVSDLSSPTIQPHPPQHFPVGHYGRAFDGGQPSGSGRQHDVVASETRGLPRDTYPAAFTSTMEGNDGEDLGGEGKTSALQYTKSVMERFWTGQDLLIAVMGYVVAHVSYFCVAQRGMLTFTSSPPA